MHMATQQGGLLKLCRLTLTRTLPLRARFSSLWKPCQLDYQLFSGIDSRCNLQLLNPAPAVLLAVALPWGRG